MKKCPPGVICIENITIFFIVICALVIVYIINSKQHVAPTEKIVINESRNVNESRRFWPNYPYTTDVLLNPYSPPL